jgi:hypothetical protein
MATLLCFDFPFLRIYIPEPGEIRQFQFGKLEIDESDPAYPVVMAEASRNPAIVVYVSEGTCKWCGETFTKSKLEAHVKEVHYDKWTADEDAAIAEVRNIELKARAGHACDVCRPAQVFGSEDDLILHIQAFHAQPPVLNDAGDVTEEATGGRRRRRPGEVESIPAARAKE